MIIKLISYSAVLLLGLSGCGASATPQAQSATKEGTIGSNMYKKSENSAFVEKENISVYTKEEEAVLAELSKLSRKNIDKKIKKDLLIKDSVYANKNTPEALVENKKDDFLNMKPLYLEPTFTKIEIMPYQTTNGLYHEQQAVWLKVKEGGIVIKSNSSNLPPNALTQSILNR